MGSSAESTMSEVEETLKRISSHKGVIGTVIVNNEGVPIRSNLERSEQTAQYASLITQLTAKARSVVRDLDPQNDLTFLRMPIKREGRKGNRVLPTRDMEESGRQCTPNELNVTFTPQTQ